LIYSKDWAPAEELITYNSHLPNYAYSQALVIPVTYSLISLQALQEVLLPLYLLPKDSKVVLLYQGMHDTYLIKGTSSKFILRIYRSKTFQQVEAELQLLLLLNSQELTVSCKQKLILCLN
jgi:hypothetical protein